MVLLERKTHVYGNETRVRTVGLSVSLQPNWRAGHIFEVVEGLVADPLVFAP